MRIRLLLWTAIPSEKQKIGEISTLQIYTKVSSPPPPPLAPLSQKLRTPQRDVTSKPVDAQGGVSGRPARQRHALSDGSSLIDELLGERRCCKEEEKQ